MSKICMDPKTVETQHRLVSNELGNKSGVENTGEENCFSNSREPVSYKRNDFDLISVQITLFKPRSHPFIVAMIRIFVPGISKGDERRIPFSSESVLNLNFV